MPDEHRLERRSRLLAEKMRDAADALATQLGAGERAPFTTALTNRASLDWWRQHRYDEFGAKALARLQPWQVAQLDHDLVRAMNPEEPATPTVQEVA